jgi:hypothetical protein
MLHKKYVTKSFSHANVLNKIIFPLKITKLLHSKLFTTLLACKTTQLKVLEATVQIVKIARNQSETATMSSE